MDTRIGTDIAIAVQLLKENEIVALPTETVYGLAGNALQEDALLKIFEAKNRPHFNPLIAHCASWEQAQSYVDEIPKIAHLLAQKFCPGPLSFLLKKKNNVPDLISAGSPLMAIRIPQHPICRAVLEQIDFPLAAPSANPFGYISPTNAQHVFCNLKGKIPYILDGGSCTIGIESTIIGFDADENIILYREGGISREALKAFSGKSILESTQFDAQKKPQSSGQLKSHYAPETALLLGDIETLYTQVKHKKVGILSFTNPYLHLACKERFVLSKQGSLQEAAKNLFSFLRKIDACHLDYILAEPVPAEGLGLAINDRLKRAQALFK